MDCLGFMVAFAKIDQILYIIGQIQDGIKKGKAEDEDKICKMKIREMGKQKGEAERGLREDVPWYWTLFCFYAFFIFKKFLCAFIFIKSK